jgi:hypothetical protein
MYSNTLDPRQPSNSLTARVVDHISGIVNGHSFKTKKALREHIHKIRDRYIDGQHLNEADFEFMLYFLLNLHEEPEIKRGCGVYVCQNK